MKSRESNDFKHFISHKHLTFIFYYNIVSKTPLYILNNQLVALFKASEKSQRVFSSELSHSSSKDSLPGSTKSEKIPRIMHKVWLTHPSNPFEIPEKLWETLKKFISELSDIVVYLWVMDKENIKSSLKALVRANPGKIIVKTADELLQMMAPNMKSFFQMLFETRFLAKASDVIRLYALFKYGGVFTDLDMLFKRDLMYILNYDMAVTVFRTEISYIAELYLMGFTPGHPALASCFEVWEKMEELKKKELVIVDSMEVFWRNSFVYVVTIGVIDGAINHKGKSALFLSYKEINEMVIHDYDYSWGVQRKYGNAFENKPSYSEGSFDEYMRIFSRSQAVKINHF